MTHETITRPCVGCGYCCMKARCSVSMAAYDTYTGTDCPALYFEDERYWCWFAKEKLGRKLLYIGEGCPMTLFNTQREAFLRGEGREYVRNRLKDDREAERAAYRKIREHDKRRDSGEPECPGGGVQNLQEALAIDPE